MANKTHFSKFWAETLTPQQKFEMALKQTKLLTKFADLCPRYTGFLKELPLPSEETAKVDYELAFNQVCWIYEKSIEQLVKGFQERNVDPTQTFDLGWLLLNLFCSKTTNGLIELFNVSYGNVAQQREFMRNVFASFGHITTKYDRDDADKSAPNVVAEIAVVLCGYVDDVNMTKSKSFVTSSNSDDFMILNLLEEAAK